MLPAASATQRHTSKTSRLEQQHCRHKFDHVLTTEILQALVFD